MSKAYRNFKQLVKKMNEDPNCNEHGYTPEKPTMSMFRRQIHYSEKFWKGIGRLSVYWTRKRNRKERYKNGWVKYTNSDWGYFKDGCAIGAVYNWEIGVWTAINFRGFRDTEEAEFHTRAEAQRWVEEILP